MTFFRGFNAGAVDFEVTKTYKNNSNIERITR
jgi:hypothetical protein